MHLLAFVTTLSPLNEDNDTAGWALGNPSLGESFRRFDDRLYGRIQRMVVAQVTWRSTEPISVSMLLLATAVRVEYKVSNVAVGFV